METTSAIDFLDQIEATQEAQELRDAVQEEESSGRFTVNRSGNDLLIQDTLTHDLWLRLEGPQAKAAFLELLETRYGGDLGIDGQMDYERQMEKD